MGIETESYRLSRDYQRPESKYDPSQLSRIEDYKHPPTPGRITDNRTEVYPKLSEEVQKRLARLDWYADYDRFGDNNESVHARLEVEVLLAIGKFEGHDITSLVSDKLNVHRFDVVRTISLLKKEGKIKIGDPKFENVRISGFELTENQTITIAS